MLLILRIGGEILSLFGYGMGCVGLEGNTSRWSD